MLPAGFRGSAVISATSWSHPPSLAAAVVRRVGTSFGTDVPGDEAGVTLGAPLRRLSPEVEGPAGDPCAPPPIRRLIYLPMLEVEQ